MALFSAFRGDCQLIDDFESASSSFGLTNWAKDEEDSLVVFSRNIHTNIFEGKNTSNFSGYDDDNNYWLGYTETQNINWISYLSDKGGTLQVAPIIHNSQFIIHNSSSSSINAF